MASVRGATMIEGLGEPEQDANSALTDLDKGLRSNNVGQQCEAIVRFPRLFEKYPFPILINSSFLKLADVFRVGNNFLRLWILRVCQESEKHLDKILNVDEFVRRVFSVIHANDPVARALSLRTLGSVACIIPERQQVHHSIRNSLDSHDTIEVEAAIYAAMQFAAQSKSFAVGMCNKISDMIQGLSTPAHMKLQLIPILQYMHHDTSTAAMVRKVCTELLPKYPAKDFVITTLKTLTKLAASTLVDIPNQVELLLQYLVDDCRWGVKVVAVDGLYQLAKVSPHLWPPQCLSTAIHVARSSENKSLISMALDLFIVLTKSPVVCHEYVDPDSELMQLYRETCYSSDPVISAKSVRIITQIVCFMYEEGFPLTVVEEYIVSVESLLLYMISAPNGCAERRAIQDKVLASCLQCAVMLCRVHHPLTNHFIQLIARHLTVDSCRLLLCEALAGIAGLEPQALEGYLPDILNAIESLANSNLESDSKTKVMLCTLLLQTVQPVELNSSCLQAINSLIENIDPWCKYKIARAAARYGHFKVCCQVIGDLTEKVSSEHLHFWLQGLVEMSSGESALCANKVPLLDRLGTAISHYNTAISSLKAGSSPSNSLAFQCEYAGLRCELLQCFSQLVSTCNSLCFSPPPAIAVTLMHTTRDELQRYGHITNQLRKCAKAFRSCADLYWKLYQSAFDADPASLKNIQIIQHTCLMMAYSIECLALPNQQSDEPSLEYGLKGSNLETQIMIESCKAASVLTTSISKNSKTITHEHIDCLIDQVEILITNPLCLPRYFFQVLQSTSVKLAVSPQPKVLGESISLTSGSQLAVKVEGVIQHGARACLFRSVDRIIVSLTNQLVPRTNNSNEKAVESSGCTMTQTVKPHKDFFTAQFLVSLGAGSAQATVTVAASVIDQNGCVWQTGPKSTLTVKQHDDPANRPI